MSKKELTYSDALAELKEIAARVEDPNADLSQCTKDVRRAMELVKFCKEYITGIQQEMNKVLEESQTQE